MTPFEKCYQRSKNGCWLWAKAVNTNGYGYKWHKGKLHHAHRVSWELNRGPIPDGLFVLHRCDVKLCVNPEHLFLGTQTDNMRDAMAKGIGKFFQKKTHCKRGHPLVGENIYIDSQNTRQCLECTRTRKLAWYHKHKKAA